VHIPITIGLIKTLGITGGAIAVAVMRVEELLLYEWAARRWVGRAAADGDDRQREIALLACAALLGALLTAAAFSRRVSLAATIAVALVSIVAYASIAWTQVFSSRERAAWTGMLARR
jgi:hypothetical protein